jgi:hypothetical protein
MIEISAEVVGLIVAAVESVLGKQLEWEKLALELMVQKPLEVRHPL